MVLKSFAVERYRAFKSCTEIELRPITLLFGHNSAGKSALLRLVPLLRDTIRDGRAPLFLGSEAVRGARFGEILCDFDPHPVLAVELATKHERARYEIRDLSDQHRQILERVERVRGDERWELEWTTNGDEYELSRDGGSSTLRPLVDGLDVRSHDPQLEWLVPARRDILESQWLDAVRARVRRRTPMGPRPRGPMASDGSDAPLILGFAKLDHDPLCATVQEFYRDYLGHRLLVEPIGDDFRLLVSPLEQPAVQISLVDTGEGLSQVLPVAVALAQASLGNGSSLLALEQPELHLHPRLHEKLAAWMCRCVKQDSETRLLVETHSENVLLALMVALLDGTLSAEDVAIYWVHQLEDGQSVADEVTLDEYARPQGPWPPDVFQEDADLAARLNALRMEKRTR